MKKRLSLSDSTALHLEQQAEARGVPSSAIVEEALQVHFRSADDAAWQRIGERAAAGKEAKRKGGEKGREKRYGKDGGGNVD